MSHSSADRGYLEPLGALVAVSAVGIALSMYLGVYADSVDRSAVTSEHASSTAASIVHTQGGVISPTELDRLVAQQNNAGRYLHLSLETDQGVDTAGPEPPPGVETATATRPVAVESGSGGRDPGRLTVTIWHE